MARSRYEYQNKQPGDANRAKFASRYAEAFVDSEEGESSE